MFVQEFNSMEAAQALMNSEARDSLTVNGKPLTLDYSISQYGAKSSQAGDAADWMCTMCQAINFSRHVQPCRANLCPHLNLRRRGHLLHLLKLMKLSVSVSSGNLPYSACVLICSMLAVSRRSKASSWLQATGVPSVQHKARA